MAYDLNSSLQSYFNFTNFRPGQVESLQNLQDGHHTLVVMPTGSGKSLIYQLAAMHLPGIALVISPLIALMKDQVDSLTRRGIPATFINSSLTSSEQNQRLNGAASGKYKLIYVAPERFSPNAGFTVGAAMGRNRLIYCLADYAIVVASEAEKGGTWAGATEALKAGWLPIYVLQHPKMPDGNRQLLQRGAQPFPHPFPEHYSKLPQWLEANSPAPKTSPSQLGLF